MSRPRIFVLSQSRLTSHWFFRLICACSNTSHYLYISLSKISSLSKNPAKACHEVALSHQTLGLNMPSSVTWRVTRHLTTLLQTSRHVQITAPAPPTNSEKAVQRKAGRACLKVSVPFHAKPARKPVNTPRFLSAGAKLHQ